MRHVRPLMIAVSYSPRTETTFEEVVKVGGSGEEEDVRVRKGASPEMNTS